MYKVREKSDGTEKERGGAKPSARLSDLRWIRTRWKGLEEDTCLVYKEREGSTACFRAKDIIHVCVVAEVTTAWVGVDGAMDKCVLAGEGAAAVAGDVVVGVSAVFEGVSSSEVVVGEASCTGCVKLPVTGLPALPSRFLNSIWSPQRVSGDRYVMVYSCSTQETLKVSLTHACGYLGLALATANSFWLPALGPVVVISMTTLSTLIPVVRPIVPSELETAARTSTEL